MSPRQGPSRVWTRVLHALAPSEDRDDVVRELVTLYRRRTEHWGRAAADRWFRREVINFVFVARIDRLRSSSLRRGNHSKGGAWTDLGRDVARAVRSLVKAPGFTVVAIATFTLGIGATTLIFSVVDHVALRALPYHAPDRLVQVWPGIGMLRGELHIMQQESKTLAEVAGYVVTDGVNLETSDGTRRIEGTMVSPTLLDVLRVRPRLGRNFQPEEAQRGSDGVVLLAHRLWQEQYGADPDVIGRPIVLDGRARTVVGVLPGTFVFPRAEQDVLVPLVMEPSDVGVFWGWGGHRAIARLQPGATPESARDELRSLSRQMRDANPLWTPTEDFRADTEVVPLREALVGDIQPTLLILLGAVGLVLLVACANVANLLLARGLSRSRDIALRAALGASRWRIAREQIVESVLLASIGSVVAVIVAYWALNGLVALLPAEIPRVEEITLDARVVGVGVTVALVAGALAGLLPAVHGSRTDPGMVLRASGRGTAGATRRRRRLASAMVIAQVAVAVVLVTDAGLLVRSLRALAAVETGFLSDGVTTARLTLAPDTFEGPEQRYRFYEQVVERVKTIPGVATAAIGSRVPFGIGRSGVATFIDGVTEDPNNLPVLSYLQVTPGYLRTLGIPLLEGRGIEPADGPDAPLVAVVDKTAAERFWPGRSPVGRRIRYPWRGAPWIEIVGVVGAVSDRDLGSERSPTYYVPLAQRGLGAVNLVVRADAADQPLGPAIRAIVRDVDERVPVSRLGPLGRLVSESMARARWTASLLSLFAATTLLLGCVGVYGIVAYAVRARTREIGVRMALGADRGGIRAAVLKDGMRLVLPGTAVGMLLAVPGARLLAGLLFGVSALDPTTFGLVPVVLTAAAIVAVYLPARRATHVDPVEALRAEM